MAIGGVPVLSDGEKLVFLDRADGGTGKRVFKRLGAGTSRATGRPCLVISISSPAVASSCNRSIVAFASVAVTCLTMWPL